MMVLLRITLIGVVVIASLASAASAIPVAPVNPVKKGLKFRFGRDTIKGVNLGGWLVLEVSRAPISTSWCCDRSTSLFVHLALDYSVDLRGYAGKCRG